MEEHPTEAYELLEWIENDPDTLPARDEAPEHLRPWYAYLLEKGLVHEPTLMTFRTHLTRAGKVALLLKSQVQQEHKEQRKQSGMSVKEVIDRLEQLRSQGDQFTSQHKLAKQLGCSSRTINKAIRQTPSLQKWAKPATAQPRAQSINEFVSDRTAQSTEPDPAEDAAIREYLEREDLTPDERAFFNGLSRNDQLDFLDDPDQHQRILGRKP